MCTVCIVLCCDVCVCGQISNSKFVVHFRTEFAHIFDSRIAHSTLVSKSNPIQTTERVIDIGASSKAQIQLNQSASETNSHTVKPVDSAYCMCNATRCTYHLAAREMRQSSSAGRYGRFLLDYCEHVMPPLACYCYRRFGSMETH